ncbi:MAG: hypothetical protein MUF87_19505 [Anaerolineae bacterium]|jgi:hypothetical protein|nr:hypothetical protein [Anaerolineae bacterium]
MPMILKQRPWTEIELRAQGFAYYERKKQLVLAGRLPSTRAPLPILYDFETVYAQAGDVICFTPTEQIRKSIMDYTHWSVKPDIFRETYRIWDAPHWTPNAGVQHLMRHGCRPYYKHQGVWAKQLTEPLTLQSLESAEPTEVPVGAWLAIGSQGEPWHIAPENFYERYLSPKAEPQRHDFVRR